MDAACRELYEYPAGQNKNYFDFFFEMMPLDQLSAIAAENARGNGIVEAYLFFSLQAKQDRIAGVRELLASQSPQNFDVPEFLAEFQRDAGLVRNTGQAFELVVHALFDVLASVLGARVVLSVDPRHEGVMEDFGDFCNIMLGIGPDQAPVHFPARMFRVGTTYSNDGGLDIWSNFGPIVQVKHMTVSLQEAQDVESEVRADRIVIVCKDAHRDLIQAVLTSSGLLRRVKGIVTEADIVRWYGLALGEKYAGVTVPALYQRVVEEFEREFSPAVSSRFTRFAEMRSYRKESLMDLWAITE